MAGRVCEAMQRAIDMYRKGKTTVAECAERCGVTKRGLYYALRKAGVSL